MVLRLLCDPQTDEDYKKYRRQLLTARKKAVKSLPRNPSEKQYQAYRRKMRAIDNKCKDAHVQRRHRDFLAAAGPPVRRHLPLPRPQQRIPPPRRRPAVPQPAAGVPQPAAGVVPPQPAAVVRQQERRLLDEYRNRARAIMVPNDTALDIVREFDLLALYSALNFAFRGVPHYMQRVERVFGPLFRGEIRMPYFSAELTYRARLPERFRDYNLPILDNLGGNYSEAARYARAVLRDNRYDPAPLYANAIRRFFTYAQNVEVEQLVDAALRRLPYNDNHAAALRSFQHEYERVLYAP